MSDNCSCCGGVTPSPDFPPHLSTNGGVDADGSETFEVHLTVGDSIAALDLDLCGDAMLRSVEEITGARPIGDEVCTVRGVLSSPKWSDRPDTVHTWHRTITFAGPGDEATEMMINSMMLVFAGHYQARLAVQG